MSVVSPQVGFVARLDLPMCLSLKQQGCLRWLACWAAWATNKESCDLSFILGYVICTCIKYMVSDVFVLSFLKMASHGIFRMLWIFVS